jgi:ketosteroid isomerase-like protein
MSAIAHFARYAAAFEKAYASDDWTLVAPFFTDDAVYEAQLPPPIGGRFAGRDAILAYFRFVLDGFDRRFATRTVSLVDGPRADGDSVWIRGCATYTAPGVPDLAFELEETAWFTADGRIRRLEDRYDEATLRSLVAYMDAHGARLGISSGG